MNIKITRSYSYLIRNIGRKGYFAYRIGLLMSSPIVRRVIVLGAGSAGFLSAVSIKRLLPHLDVSIVYSTKIPVIGVGESTTIAIPRFSSATAGAEERALMANLKVLRGAIDHYAAEHLGNCPTCRVPKGGAR